jgi:hypothetical protein
LAPPGPFWYILQGIDVVILSPTVLLRGYFPASRPEDIYQNIACTFSISIISIFINYPSNKYGQKGGGKITAPLALEVSG